jgi:hypothetical protein
MGMYGAFAFLRRMKKMKEIKLSVDEVAVVQLEKGTVHIHWDGLVSIDQGNQGITQFDLFHKSWPHLEQKEIPKVFEAPGAPLYSQAEQPLEVSEEEKEMNLLSGYLYLLIELQKVNHGVPKEINEALQRLHKIIVK